MVTSIIDLYCKIFVNFQGDRLELFEKLKGFLKFNSAEMNSIITNSANIDIYRNEDFNPTTHGDFLFFEYFLEVYPTEIGSLETQIEIISKLLLYFWELKIYAVAACDFEDKLPQNGGYKDQKIYDP